MGEIRAGDIREVRRFPGGVIELPASKSITHRMLICAGLAEGRSVIRSVTLSEDIIATTECMRAAGAEINEVISGEEKGCTLTVDGIGSGQGSGSTQGIRIMDCCESGTTLRFLIPIAATLEGETVFSGRGRLMRRPLVPFLDALRVQGAAIQQTEDSLRVKGPLIPGRFFIPGDISSQYVSGLLLALAQLRGDSEIILTSPLQSASYAGLTVGAMEEFGVRVQNDDYLVFRIRGGQRYRAGDITVEADYSQAAFFLVAGALGAPSELRGLNRGSKQGDRRIVEILESSGAVIEYTDQGITAKPGKLSAQTVDVTDIPDLVPPLAAFFAYCEGTSRIIGASRLRYKESDRLIAVTEALNALGARVEMTEDSLTIHGRERLRGGVMESFGDHRIAMMGAVTAIRCDKAVFIKGSDCVAKSYPDFWKDFESGMVD